MNTRLLSRSRGWAATIAMIGATSGAMKCVAQVEVCYPLDCENVSTLPTLKHWLPTTPSYTPDRRPVMFVQFASFNFCANYRGLAEWWYEEDDNPAHTAGDDVSPMNGIPDTFDILLAKLDEYAADGWKRIMFEFPAGSVSSNVNISSAQWWTMPEWKRDAFEGVIATWIAAHPTISVGIYMDFAVLSPCSLCMTHNEYDELTIISVEGCSTQHWYPCDAYGSAHAPDPYDPDDTCLFYQNVQPWINIGCKEVWLEAGLGAPAEFWEFCYNPDYSGTKFGGEAILPDGMGNPDAFALAATPQVATDRFLDFFDPMGTWTIPSASEAGFLVIDPHSIADLAEKVGRGFNIWLLNEGAGNSESEKIKRIYSAGPIHIADFNGSGSVTMADYSDFMTAFGASHPSGRDYNYYHGDIDNNHLINSSDLFAFLAAYFDADPYSIITNFGDPDPDSAVP